MNSIAPHITAFLREWLPKQRVASEHTCDAYAYTFKLLFKYTSEKLNTIPSSLVLEQIDSPLIQEFLKHLETARGNSPATCNARLAAIKSFTRFVEYRIPSFLEQGRQILAIPTRKTDTKLVKHLTVVEIQAILNAPDPDNQWGIRDRAMIHLCFAAGLRVSELTCLPLSAVQLHPTPNIHVLGKGRRERSLCLLKQTVSDLRAWINVRDPQPSVTQLFVNMRGLPMTRAGFEYILSKHTKRAQESCATLSKQHISPHVLRHSCAMMIFQATGDLRKVSLWLGHADMQTTEIYLRADPTEKLDTIESLDLPSLRRGHYKVPDALIASLQG